MSLLRELNDNNGARLLQFADTLRQLFGTSAGDKPEAKGRELRRIAREGTDVENEIAYEDRDDAPGDGVSPPRFITLPDHLQC